MSNFTNHHLINLTPMAVVFQNGVNEPRLSSRQIPMGSSVDSQNGNVGQCDVRKRPSKLVVNATKGFGTKPNQEDSADGSLPCTPEMDSISDASGCPAEDQALDSDTRQLVMRFIMDSTGRTKAQWNENIILSTMKRVVGQVLEKHRYAYNGMVNKLSINDRGDDVSIVSSVAKSMFSDGTNNWGRIASLLAFGAVVAQYLNENGRRDCVDKVAEDLSTYLLTDQRDWLIKNNAWDGFVDFFRVADPESTVRNLLMAVAGVAGIGATLALLIR